MTAPYYLDPREHDHRCPCGLVHKIKYRVEDASGDYVKGGRVKVTASEHARRDED